MEEAIVINPLEEAMDKALIKANVTDTVINALNQKYGVLRLRSIDDKEKYIEIKEAAKECAKIRNLAVKCCKAGREDAVAIQKKWVAKEKEVVARIAEVETPLDAEIERYEANQQRIQEEEKRKQEEAYMQRTQLLTKMGAEYSNGEFALGEFSLEANLIKESSVDVWEEEILPKFNEQFLIIEAERVEQERIKAEKEAELKRQQEELLQKQRELEAQQAEFKRIQEEKERIEREKSEAEQKEKERIKNEIQNKRILAISSYLIKGDTFDLSELYSYDEDDFNNLLDAKKKDYEEYQKGVKQALEEAAAQRERERIAEEQRLAEIKRQQEEARKAEELAKAGDKAIWNHFIEQLSKVQLPVVKSGQYRKISAIASEKIDEIKALKIN